MMAPGTTTATDSMNRYTLWWTTAAMFVFATDIAFAGNESGSSLLVHNTVCMNLVTFTLLVLLPSDDIITILVDLSPLDPGDVQQQED